MEHVFGIVTMILAVSMSVVGLPMQAWKNYREKSCGFSRLLIFLTVGVYTSRLGYGWTIGSYYIMIPDFLGSLFSSVIMTQYFLYNRKY